MKKISILGALSGALVAGSLVLAGPAYAHHGDAGDGSRAPVGQSSTSVHSATEGQIGVGIFTGQAEAAGTQKTLGVAPAYAPAPATAAQGPSVGGVSDARVGNFVGTELPIAPVGEPAPAA